MNGKEEEKNNKISSGGRFYIRLFETRFHISIFRLRCVGIEFFFKTCGAEKSSLQIGWLFKLRTAHESVHPFNFPDVLYICQAHILNYNCIFLSFRPLTKIISSFVLRRRAQFSLSVSLLIWTQHIRDTKSNNQYFQLSPISSPYLSHVQTRGVSIYFCLYTS